MENILKILSYAPVCMLVAGFVLMLAGRASDHAGLMLAGFLLGALMIPMSYLADYVRRKENEKNPITTVEATVVAHRMVTHHSRYSSSNIFYMTFKPEDGGESLEFEVPESDYQDFGAGDKGPLRYRTWEYISFCAKDLSCVEPLTPSEDEYVPADDEITVEVDWARAEKMLDMLIEKTREWWGKAKTRFQACKTQAKEEKKALEEDDGILTHELDE